MLQANCGGYSTTQAVGYKGVALPELLEMVARLSAAPRVSSLFEGALGDHAWLSVIDRGFIMHAYFGETTFSEGVISFEIYGPYPPGTERAHGDPYDGRGLAGTMTTQSLKEVL